MKVYFTIIFVFILIEFVLSKPTPAPEPQFPFTVLPPPGKGHRRYSKLNPDYAKNRGRCTAVDPIAEN